TYSEIGSLTEDFNQLKTFYQTEKDYEIKMKEVLEMNELFSESTYHIENDEKIPYFNNHVLSPLQIKKFQKIFYQSTIKENNEQEINEKLTVILDQQEKEAFTNKLCTRNVLSGRKSNNALSFTIVLNVLTFIVNFANCHGLPSP
ncbi:28826_t:CDS:2, partial [Racocetra persica]